MASRPRVSATKLHGPDHGLSFSEATEPTHGVAAAAEEATKAVTPSTTAVPQHWQQDVEKCGKGTATKESHGLGRPAADAISRGFVDQQQAEGVLRLRGGMEEAPSKLPAQKDSAAGMDGASSVGMKEGPAVGVSDGSAASQASLDSKWQAGGMGGGTGETSPQVPVLVEGPPAGASSAKGRPAGAREQRPAGASGAQQRPAGASGAQAAPCEEPLEAYWSPHVHEAVAAEQEFLAREAPLFQRVRQEVGEAEEQARAAELKSAEAVQEARVWARVAARAEQEKEEARNIMHQAGVELDRLERLTQRAQQIKCQLASTSAQPMSPRGATPRSRRGLLALAGRLARQAANLEEEAKRKEAQAFYLDKEAEQLQALSAEQAKKAQGLARDLPELDRQADEMTSSLAAELEEAKRQYQAVEEKEKQGRADTGPSFAGMSGGREQAVLLQREALALAGRADLTAARVELHFPAAEQAMQRAEMARSAMLQAQRNARLLSCRAQGLMQQAEAAAEGARALMQRGLEKAEEGFQAKAAAQSAPLEEDEGQGVLLAASAAPDTPDSSPQGQRLAAELDRAQRGRAAAELHAAQLVEEAHRKVEHAGRLEHNAERSAVHVRRVLADAEQAHLQEEEALSRAEQAGRAASRQAGFKMAEQWVELVSSPEWRALLNLFPQAVQQLEAAAAAVHGTSNGAGR